MDAIKNLQTIEWNNWLLWSIIILFAIVAVYKLICEVAMIFNKPIGAMKQRKADHDLLIKTVQDLSDLHNVHKEDTKQSICHDELIRKDLYELTTTVNGIVDRLDIMQEKIDATEMAKLKEKILGYYRKYKDIGEWQQFEADVFWGLYDRYISHGGNSFVKHEIEPVMRNLKVID